MPRKVPFPGLTIAAVWTVFWWPVISGDAYLYIRDLTLFAAPMKHYMMARFASGELPVWTPYVSGGMPFLADPSNQIFYPPNIAFLFFGSVERALSFSIALHNLLGMYAFAWLCRVLGISRWIAAWSGITYGLTGYILSIGDNVNFLPAVAWIPLAIATFQLGIDKQRFQYSAFTALCLAFVVLAGDPQNAVLLAGVLVLLSILAAWTDRPENASKYAAVYFPGAHLLLTLALSFVLTAAQVFPTLELVPVSVRHSTLAYEQISIWSFPVARTLELFQPYIFGSQFPTFDFLAPELYPSKSGPWAGSVYLGTIPFVLMLVGVATLDRSRSIWLLILIAALLLSFGANTPVHAMIVKYTPFFDTQRYPEKFVFWVTVSACLLAGFGAQALFEHRRLASITGARITQVTKWALGIALIGILCWLAVYLPAKTWFWELAFFELNLWKSRLPFQISHFNVLLAHTAVMLGIVVVWFLASPMRRKLFFSVMLTVAALDLFWVHYRSVPQMPAGLFEQAPEPYALRSMAPLIEQQPYRIYFDTTSPGARITFQHHELFDSLLTAETKDRETLALRGYPHLYAYLYRRDRLHPNGGILHGIQYLNAPLSPLQPSANIAYEAFLQRRDPYKAVAMANARYVVTGVSPVNPVWNDDRFVVIESNAAHNLRILENKQWLARVVLVPNAIGTRNDTEEIIAALEKVNDPRSHVAIASDTGPQPDQPLVDVPISIRQPSPERYEVSGSSPYQRAYVLLNESFMDDWQATVNGEVAQVLRANLRFMAVPVSTGPFEVVFEYRSRPLLIGAWLSCFGMLLCASFLIYPAFKRCKSS